jgi:hypothetical protein
MKNTDKITDDFINLFPITVKVTKDMIKGANIDDVCDCIGARALQKGLGRLGLKQLRSGKAGWACNSGVQILKDGTHICIESVDYDGNDVDMMGLTEPCEIELRIYEVF